MVMMCVSIHYNFILGANQCLVVRGAFNRKR